MNDLTNYDLPRIVYLLSLSILIGSCTPPEEPVTGETNTWPVPEWRAEWMAFPLPDRDIRDTLILPPPAYFRKRFQLGALPDSAILYVSALGLVDITVNGRKVTEDRFLPGWTDYRKRVYYHAYDVRSRLRKGENVIGVIVADGWYAGYVGPKSLSNPLNRSLYGTVPAFLSQLELRLPDGETRTIPSDTSWRASEGPLRYADLLMGESYDATRELPGWNEPGYESGDWSRGRIVGKDSILLERYPGNPVRAFEILPTQKITAPRPGVYLFDFGQNFAGHVRLRVSGERGDTIRLRHGERLYPDGGLMTENLRFARATDTYVLKGEGTEEWEPRFTYHGFRYVEVSGMKKRPDADLLTGIAESASTRMVGSFNSSDSMLNRLHRNIRWTQRSNFLEVPTDSPQRDERLGWLGDAQIFSRSALYNADLSDFYRKWLVDVRDAQYDFGAYANFAPRPYPKLVWYSPGWMEAGLMVPYNAYRFYGDTSLIAAHYASMRRFMDFVINKSEPLGYFYPENSWTEIGPRGGFGDWLSLTEKHVAHDLMASIYLAHSFRMMAEMSEALGYEAESRSYAEMREKSVRNFLNHYLAPDGRFRVDTAAYGNGNGYFEGERGFTGHTQSAYATALYFDVLPDSIVPLVAEHLVALVEAAAGKPTTGILGIRQLLPALAKIGRSDLAYDMLLDPSYPGWAFQIEQGATTIWERWNGYTPEKGFNGPMNAKMNSFNHYALGAVGQFLYANIGGIRPASPGFGKIVIDPEIGTGQLKSARVAYESTRGTIRSSWSITEDAFTLDVVIPEGTVATVYVPVAEGGSVSASRHGNGGSAPAFAGRERGKNIFSVGAGRYRFLTRIGLTE